MKIFSCFLKDVLNVRNENSFFIFLKLSGFALNQTNPTIDTAITAMPMPDSAPRKSIATSC